MGPLGRSETGRAFSGRSGTVFETVPRVRDGSGETALGPGWVRDPRGGPGRVKWRLGTVWGPSLGFKMSRGKLPEVRDGSGTLGKVWDR